MDYKTEAVQRMQDYIKSHLEKEISLSDLSSVSLYSPWYSRRLFVELLGISPSDYVRKLKLKEAALKLRDDKVKIIDVAYEFGFNSVDGFQRAFYKEFGCNPKEYSNSPIPLPLFIPYGVKYKLKGNTKSMNQKKHFYYCY